MADDPHRDLLPVREGSCIDTCRSSILDSRERHAVCKLDRYQLEDRYLRLHDEVQRLKKLSNSQEDKIKRLGTKLMRVAATPRSCLAVALDFNNDKNRIDFLELENAKLKDKITVLRNQILNHTIVGRSPSRSRRLQICNSSGPTTCRSAIGRLKSSSSQLIHDREDDNESQNFVAKIEELEMQKKEMASKIEDLESQLASHKIGNQREKVAENVEYIRVWRQMKLQNDELASIQAANVKMTEQIRELNALLEEKTRNNKEITTALVTEKKKLAEMDEQLARAKDSQLTMREKDEQIKDLMSEMKILHQHNSELLALSSKYSQVEFENVELKKKISEQLTDNQSLRSAFSNEQANFTALQAANEQLMGKLHDLQKNIDSLTIQLKSFQSQNERYEKYRTEHEKVRTVDRQTSTNSLPEKSALSEDNTNCKTDICKNCCQELRERVSTSPRKNFVDHEVQTENPLPNNFTDSQDAKNYKQSPIRHIRNSPIRDRSNKSDNIPENLTPDEMLKILDQAQINTPVEVEDAAIIRQLASSTTNNYVNSVQPGSSATRVTKKTDPSMPNDPWTILLIMYRVLREFNDTKASSSVISEANTFFPTSSRPPLDLGSDNFLSNRIQHYPETKVPDVPIVEHSRTIFHDKSNNTVPSKMKQDLRESPKDIVFHNEELSVDHPFGEVRETLDEISREIVQETINSSSHETSENCATIRRRNFLNKFTETSDCICNQDMKCSEDEDCGYACVQPNFKMEVDDSKFVHCRCDVIRSPFKSVVRDISTSIQNTFDSIHISRTRAEETSDQSYKSWQRPYEIPELTRPSWEKYSKVLVCKKTEKGRFSAEPSFSKVTIPKKESNSKIKSQLTLDSQLKMQSVSSLLSDSLEKNLVDSGKSNKELSNSSLMDNNIVFEARESSHQSKDSRVISLMPDGSSPPQEKIESLPHHKLTNNTSQQVSSAADSYITISPSVVAQSDSSSIRAMDDEDGTSSDFRNRPKKRDTRNSYSSKLIIEEESKSKDDDTEKIDTTSVKEFNDLIRNGTLLSSRGSSSTVQDLSTVITNDNWEKYKKRSLANQSRRPSSKPFIQTAGGESRNDNFHLISDPSIGNSDVVIIRIESISLFQRCSLLEDSEIHQLYVEFSFLGYRGVELETVSVPKPTATSPALFNYMRKFEIDEKQHPVQRSIMRAMMTENDNPTIKFIVVSEPLLEEMETKECTEVGYAYFDIRDHILSGRFKEVSLTIMDAEQIEPIGILKITLLGADAIRRCISDL